MVAAQTDSEDRFIRMSDVENLTGLKNSQIYEMIGTGDFPRQIKIGGASRWSLAEVRGWMAELKTARLAKIAAA